MKSKIKISLIILALFFAAKNITPTVSAASMCLPGQADMEKCYINNPIDGNTSGVCISGVCKSTSPGVPLDLSYADGCGPVGGAYCGGVSNNGGNCMMYGSVCKSSVSGTSTPPGSMTGTSTPPGSMSGTSTPPSTMNGTGVEMPTFEETGLSDAPIRDILINLLRWLLMIVGILAMIGFVISGMQYMLAAGSESIMETAKKNMTYSIIGVIVVLGSFVIIQAIGVALQGAPGI